MLGMVLKMALTNLASQRFFPTFSEKVCASALAFRALIHLEFIHGVRKKGIQAGEIAQLLKDSLATKVTRKKSNTFCYM